MIGEDGKVVFGVIDSLQGKAVLAPLAGITNLPFRLLARSFGCPLCWTEMISVNGLTRQSSKTFDYLKSSPEDRPLVAQLFGVKPELMAEAAMLVETYAPDIIDINMGCPVKKVVRAGAGAALLKNPPLVGRILEAVVKSVQTPVTVKIRSGWSASSCNAGKIAKIAEESGVSAIIIHGRTAEQGFSGRACREIIAQVKNSVKIPVIGNGDINKPEDALEMLAQTGCNAVMAGRGALGNPWIFQEINRLSAGLPSGAPPSPADRLEIIKKHWELEKHYLGQQVAARSFRKHLLWYTKGLPGSSRLREILGKITDSGEMFATLDRYFQYIEKAENEITS